MSGKTKPTWRFITVPELPPIDLRPKPPASLDAKRAEKAKRAV